MTEGNFEIEVVCETEEVTTVKLTSKHEHGLPRYSPSFIADVMSALSANLHIENPNVLLEALESEGLHELIVRVFPPRRYDNDPSRAESYEAEKKVSNLGVAD